VQLDDSECIRKKGNVKQIYYKNASEIPSGPESTPDFTLFLLGDTGDAHCAEPVNEHFYSKLLKHQTESSVVFLGDNVYPNGIPYNSGKKKKIAQAKLEIHLDRLVDYSHTAYFVAGNHDYHKVFKSPKRILAQQELIRSYDQKSKGEIAYRPIDQAGDMVELIALNSKIAMLAMDSQWALKKINKRNTRKLFREPLERALKESENYEYLIIAAHHPLYTVGDHGHEKLFIASEDLHRKKYRKLINEIEPKLPSGVKIIYAAGHDHSLQHIKLDNFHQIVSGSGSKSNHIIGHDITSDSLKIALENHLADEQFMKKRSRFETSLRNLEFATNYKGYIQLDFYHQNGGEVWMKAFGLDNEVEQLYVTRLF
jgi:UDP-2,3-diacylglucosamine pyrophosphatase LpxH